MDDGKVTITIEIDAEVLWPHAGRSRGAVLQILCRPKDTGSCD